MSIHIF